MSKTIVKITRKDGAKFKGSFDSKSAAELWVKNHKAKGKDAVIIHSHERIVGAKVLSESTDFTGKRILEQELPAEYEVEYIEEHMDDREAKMKALISKRDEILGATDYLFIADVPTPSKERKIYMEYRQYLRDIPQKIRGNDMIILEPFDHWLRRKHPEEFMDGGRAEIIIHRFTYYYRR